MALPEPKDNNTYTYADYKNFPDTERWELIQGVPYAMGPSPKTRHQEILLNCIRVFDPFFQNNPCRLFIAPIDVTLMERPFDNEEKIDTVVQPDLLVVCDNEKIGEDGVRGAPDFIAEIISPGTAYKDQTEKLKLYEKHGVKLYWVINPDAEYLFSYALRDDGSYAKPETYRKGESVELPFFEGLSADLGMVFSD